uniref:CUB domain-containing protein n=1 Tax=Neolamprologus brichardi TaxID=32507 RepID=A0A3Q4ICB8_NEOBR
ISRLYCCLSECQQLSTTEPEMHGQIQSPQYPRPYPPHLQKQWDLWVPRGYQIQLSLTHLDIKASADCSQDSLTVRALIRSEFKKYFKQDTKLFILQFSILTFLFPGNKLTLVFQTSDSTPEHQQHTGFSATYKAIASCGGCVFDKHEGHLTSPGYPKPSPPFLSCKYIISVEPRYIVTLNFRDNFHIDNKDNQHGSSCQGHFLKVTTRGRLAMRFCGTKSPGLIVTNSSTVRLDYHTEEEGLSNGWSLQYTCHARTNPVSPIFSTLSSHPAKAMGPLYLLVSDFYVA